MIHTVRAQEVPHAVERESLADRAEVQRDAFATEAHRSIEGVELDERHPDSGTRRGNRLLGGKAALAAEEPPALAERRGGDVKRAFGGGIDFGRSNEQRKQLRVCFDRFLVRAPVDPRQFARLPENRHDLLETVRFVESGAGER